MSGRPGDWELSWSSDHHRRAPAGTCLWLAALSWYVLLARRSQLVRFVSLSHGTFRVPLSWYMPVACCSQLLLARALTVACCSQLVQLWLTQVKCLVALVTGSCFGQVTTTEATQRLRIA